MITIIQDYKSWYNAVLETKEIKRRLLQHKENITELCSEDVFKENIKKEYIYKNSVLFSAESVEFPSVPAQVHYSSAQINQHAINNRASACFYKFDGIVKPCINVSLDKNLTNVRCSGCSHFKYLDVYQSLSRELKEAKSRQNKAMQKLLKDFCFWRNI